MKKINIIIIVALIGILSFTIFSPLFNKDDSSSTDSSEKLFDKAELSKYDGKEGRPAYIAVDGIVYDVTNADSWAEGKHNDFEAGKDLTYEINTNSPHGISKLEGLPVVGKYLLDEC
ncbi:cytochrome b5 domain-containing protein [Alkaliphilus serpentinus]|uniref:Cytochrome b5 heme-binding domain-containing protein n=1 Tax=Alkaliphilus serpentinus TaxID=1482731 RepID=A0A833HN70_9FIRM|nr:cytochrome b5 domain-containing protein [Alkaliphilus serpentinus]KAB3527582.1 hypothetical protein F8153_11390 [Alkaliphilus serpentinus]